MDLTNLEDHIKAEYGVISAFIALHPKLTVAAALIGAWLFGHFRWPF